jgi:hypothetical protein
MIFLIIINNMKKLFFTAVALLILSATTGARAQVTVGSTADPQPFSILELVSDGTKGLRLPQFNLCDYNTLTVHLEGLTGETAKKAQGLQVFNTCSGCVETWNGTKWIKQCEERQDCVEIPEINCTDCICVPRVRFAKFNLGANPQYDTPKKQMEYLANNTATPNVYDSQAALDATVFGGLYQWGRKDTDYAVDAANFKRYSGNSDHATSMSDFTLANYESDGQPKSEYADKHLLDATGTTANHDYVWLVKNTGSSLWDAVAGRMAPGRWGNGVVINNATPGGGVLFSNGRYYQKPVKTVNDPCPNGFRVPTQDEWERICAYDCKPNVADGYFTTTVSGGDTGKGLTWVPVVCTAGTINKCVPKNTWSQYVNSSGYAIYKTEVWNSAKTSGVYAGWDGTTNGFSSYPSLHDAAAPEPLLFLPIAGSRDYKSGVVTNTSSTGSYCSSSVYNTHVRCLRLSNGNVYPGDYVDPGYGLSVRCVAE